MIKRYLLPLAFLFLIISVVAGGFFAYVLSETNRALLNEKVLERQVDLDIIAAQLDKYIEVDADWGTYDYERIIAHTMEHLDKVEMTFAAAYDENLELFSQREASYTGSYFEPTSFPEFITAVKTEESGVIELWYEDSEYGVEGRMMKVIWKWIPSNQELDNRFLTVVAISEFTIKTQTLDRIWLGVALVPIFMGGTCLLFLTLFMPTQNRNRKGNYDD